MSERVVSFGAAGGLIGVLSEPPPGKAVAGAPAVLLWNVGMHHRVGPFRIYVDMARRLAAVGFVSLRFDASGLGDSEVRKDALGEQERAADDLRQAMALVEAKAGVRRFVLVGFCSSVDAAHAVAVAEPRVAGAVFIEPYVYRTAGAVLRYPLRLFSRERWVRLIDRHLPSGLQSRETGSREEIFLRDIPTREAFAADVQRMVARGARLLFVYVGGDSLYQYAGQFFEIVGESVRGRIELLFYPKADHTFFRVRDRREVIERIAAWLLAAFA